MPLYLKRFSVCLAGALLLAFAAGSDARLLAPGSGFTGPTATPAPRGEVDSEATAIARWTEVPFQTVSERIELGVVAFHIHGIQRVSFSANGGPWLDCTAASVNPRTGVREYWVVLDPAQFQGESIEVRAVAYPRAGRPRVLAGTFAAGAVRGEYSLMLFREGRELQIMTLTPENSLTEALRTIEDGGEIHLAPGVYDLAKLSGRRQATRWITVRPAEGVGRDDVIIRPTERRTVNLSAGKVRWRNVTFDFATIERILTAKGDMHWFDGCRWHDSNGWAQPYENYYPALHPNAAGFMTDCLLEDMIYGAAGLHFVRGTELRRLSGDVFQNNGAVLDCRVSQIDGRVRNHHTDLMQFWAPQDTRVLENRVFVGIDARDLYCQQLFMRTAGGATFRDMAFVDVAMRMIPLTQRPSFKSQLYCRQEHVLFINVRSDLRLLLRGPGDALPGEGYQPRDVLFEDCRLEAATWPLLRRAGMGITIRGGERIHGAFE